MKRKVTSPNAAPPSAPVADPHKCAWRIPEYAIALACSRSTVNNLIKRSEVETVHIGAMTVITTPPREFLARKAAEQKIEPVISTWGREAQVAAKAARQAAAASPASARRRGPPPGRGRPAGLVARSGRPQAAARVEDAPAAAPAVGE